MSIELRFKERESTIMQAINPGIIGSGAKEATVTRRILQFRQGPTMESKPTKWQDVPCVGVDDE